MSVEVVTFGCRLNIVESEAMRRAALAAGHRELTIVNTCAVTAEAARQSRQAVRRAGRERPDAPVVVTGCAAEIDPGRFRALAEVRAIVPNAAKSASAVWHTLLSETGLTKSSPDAATGSMPTVHTRGFVEVQNGCDHRCTFCIIPFGRGASRSVSPETVVHRVRGFVAAGAREVVLTGVDVTAYAEAGLKLGDLVQRILAEVQELPRLRLSSLDCIEADPALMACLAEEPRLMPHLHLSVQAGSDLLLKRMARRHRRSDVVEFCRAVRAARPDTVFGADFIAGFPTESEASFGETLDLIAECGLTYVHAFPFSSRPGTPAARMPPVSGDIVRERAGRLRACGDRQLRQHLDRQVGRHLAVLTERGGLGHAEDFTRVRISPSMAPGQIVPTVASAHDGRVLIADAPSDRPQLFRNHTAE